MMMATPEPLATSTNISIPGLDAMFSGTEGWGVAYGPRDASPKGLADLRSGERLDEIRDVWLVFLRRATKLFDENGLWATFGQSSHELESGGDWHPADALFKKIADVGFADPSLGRALVWYAHGENLLSNEAAGGSSLGQYDPPPQDDVGRLEGYGYTIKRPAETEAYLRTNHFLLSVLMEMPEFVRKYFGDDVELRLLTLENPDADTVKFDLVVHIVSRKSVIEAMEALQRFDDWWIDVSQRVRGRLIVDIDYSECSTGTITTS